MSIWEIANPLRFIELSHKLRRVLDPLAAAAIIIALIWGLFFTPADYKQGASVKIIFVHVPAAMIAINAWLMMMIASMIWFVRRHHVSALAARAAAPIGLVMTLIAIASGALWGQPIWGTYWQWEPRLTSFFVLLLCYIGYIALWSAIEDSQLAADMTAFLAIIGGVFALLSRYAVYFWAQGLHQGSTLSMDRAEHIDNAFYYPLLLAIAGFIALFISLLLYRTETEILGRRFEALLAKNAGSQAGVSGAGVSGGE